MRVLVVDDAAGEAFDKVARAIGLGYPGGPKIDKLAKEGNPHAIEFPRAKIDGSKYDFSFSGVKSAVLNYLNGCEMKNIEVNRADVAASFQQAVVDVLVERAIDAAKRLGEDKIAVAGGVASNSALRAAMKNGCEKNNITLYYPSPVFCTDNAAMIAVQGYYEYMAGTRSGLDLNAVFLQKVDDVRSLPTPCDIDCKESKSVTVFIYSCEYLTFSVCWAKKHRKIWSRHAKQN